MKIYSSSPIVILLVIIYFFIISNSAFAQKDPLLQKSLSLDIQTSNYYDLAIWSEKLGLDSSGSIEDLRSGLFSYYNLPDIKDKEVKNGRSIIIESARNLNYIKDVSINQNYVILKGEVRLEMIDSDTKTSHKIKADKIIFNQTEKTISAYGHIEYEINREGDIEYFHGESLVFEIETWNGIFFEGVSEKNRLIENKETGTSENIPFFFSGESIYRGIGDRIELNNGIITSSKKKDPYYHLGAKKIWVLGPGEWAIKNATLFVGRIPVFYFPFFFIPGNQLIFNPSIGYKNIEGYFINTTTFLLGSKDDSSADTFSFLKSNNDATVKKEKIRKGLFLQSTEKDLDTSIWPYTNNSYLKLLVDYYSRKGYFLGLDGNLKFDTLIKSLNIFTALSFSRYLYQDLDLNSSGKLYTPYRLDASGNYVSDYEESYLFGQKVPFRFAFDIDMALDLNWAKLNIILPLYSDSKFRSDFMDRQEGLKWTQLFQNSQDATTQSEPEMPSLLWTVNGSILSPVGILSPLIENLSLDKINISMNWLSAVYDHPYSQLLTDNNYNSESLLSFYYPSSIIFPDVSGKISGTLFNTVDKNKIKPGDNSNIAEEQYLKDPWSEKGSMPSEPDSDSLISPEFQGYYPLDITNSLKNFSNTLKYSIIPSFSINSIFSSEVPSVPDTIDFTPDYSIFSAQTTSSLDYSFNIYDTLLSFSNLSIFSTNYKKHYDPKEITAVWDSYLLQDKNSNNFNLNDNINITSKPFIDNKSLSESVFSYSINTKLYSRYYNSTFMDYQDNYFLWNKESISSHKAVAELKYFDSDNYQSLKISTILPPGNFEIYPELTLYFGPVTGSFKTGFQYIEALPKNYWLFKPYEGYLKYNFFDKDYLQQTVSIDNQDMNNSFSRTVLYIDMIDSNIIFSQSLDVNLNTWKMQNSTTDFQLWFFDFNYLVEDINGYSFIPISGWQADSVSRFQPSKASAGINYSYNPDPLWKNRIRLSLGVNSAWTMNLQRYTDTAFTFDVNFTIEIAEFLDLSFQSKSVNRATYRYIPGYSGELGLSDLNILTDLFKSFNFFSTKDRIESNFNIESLSINAVHHLGDWDLNLKYSGNPVLITNADNSKEYKMQSNFSIFVTWKPVPEIKKNINYSNKTISFN